MNDGAKLTLGSDASQWQDFVRSAQIQASHPMHCREDQAFHRAPVDVGGGGSRNARDDMSGELGSLGGYLRIATPPHLGI